MMRFYTWKQLKEMQPYSRQHLVRREKAGKWPRRVRFGQNRIAWVADEIDEYLGKLVLQRDPPDDLPE